MDLYLFAIIKCFFHRTRVYLLGGFLVLEVLALSLIEETKGPRFFSYQHSLNGLCC